nr:hypothetical protein [Tanacetum cinerariifolium]
PLSIFARSSLMDLNRVTWIKRYCWPHAHDYGSRDPMKSGTPSCPCDATGVKDSVCLASITEASSDYERFSLLQAGRRANYNMHNIGKTVNELHVMLKLHEQTLPKATLLLFMLLELVRSRKVISTRNRNPKRLLGDRIMGKGKNKQAYAPKPKISPPPKKENPAKDSICHECGEVGHWKRNYPQYLAELIKKKKNAASGAGGSRIFVIELNTILNRSWIYDTGCGTHICNTTQGLRASRKLKPGALSLYVGNGQREAVEAIDAFYLCLPSGLDIVLNNCHYALSITRGVIFVFRLYEDGFVNRFVDNTIQVSRNNVVYFSVVSRDCIFKIDLSNSLTNESSIYDVSIKRAKLDLDSALLAFKKRVSCISGKMAKKPYTHQVERAKDLLGLMHTDVCGLFKIMSRQEASYFVTFTDDVSRYGYVYLLKHKHEVFETFKVFQKEVENQLDKTMKSLRSDREGEYMSQEFLDHLNDHGIIAHHDDLEIDEPQSDIVPIRRSTRTRHAPDRMCLYIDAEEHELGDLGETANYKAALLDPDKWLFKKKTDMDGNVHIYKARLVAKGYTQTSEIDYEETFSPVADIRAIRILIAIAAYYDYEIWQIDVKTAFLNGYLNEEEKLKLSKSQGASTPTKLKRMQNVPYALAVGSIMYAVRCTRPDVAFAQNVTSRFQQNPGDIDMFLVYGGDKKRELKSAKQSIFATSSAEAEYIAAFDDSKEAVWVRKFNSGLDVVPTIEEPINMYCDNTGVIDIANESGITKGARHFRAKVHYHREVIEYGDIKLEKVHTNDNLAYPFTKALAFPKHSEHTRNIGMLPASSLM